MNHRGFTSKAPAERRRLRLRRFALGAFLAALSLAASASPAGAAVTFGADLSQVPEGNCSGCAAFTLKTTTGADQSGSPVKGVLVSARIRTRDEAGNGAFRVLRPTGAPNEFINIGEAPVSVTADASPAGHITEVPASVPIAIGDRLAVAFPGQNLHYLSPPSSAALCAIHIEDPPASPVQPVGAAATYEPAFCTVPPNSFEVLIAGTVEPDSSFRLGKVKRNKEKGTATVTVNVPNPGELSGSGKGVKVASAAVISKSVVPGAVKLTIRAKGKKNRKLNETGKVKVRPKITYTPTGGNPRTQSRKLKLKKR